MQSSGEFHSEDSMWNVYPEHFQPPSPVQAAKRVKNVSRAALFTLAMMEILTPVLEVLNALFNGPGVALAFKAPLAISLLLRNTSLAELEEGGESGNSKPHCGEFFFRRRGMLCLVR